jgi:hypothetical protein
VVLIGGAEGQICVWVAAGKMAASVAELNFAAPHWNPQEPAKIEHHHLM